MTKVFVLSAISASGLAGLAGAQDAHPTLPTMWTSETIDPPEGDGMESYNFVNRPTASNPSTMWSNYTLGPGDFCRRLIWTADEIHHNRYEWGSACPAGISGVECCKTGQDGNQIELQIPNTHLPFGLKTKVKSLGPSTVTAFGQNVTADGWSWGFGGESFEVYTQPCDACVNNITLVAWSVFVEKQHIATIQFKNYRGVAPADVPAFRKTFQLPDACKGAPKCNDGTDDDATDDDPTNGKAEPMTLAQAMRSSTIRKLLAPRYA